MKQTNQIPARIKTNDDLWIINIHAVTTEKLLSKGFSSECLNYQEDPLEEFNWISTFNENAKENGLEIEVIQFALIAMRENPNLTPAMAMSIGHDEWIK